MEETFHGGESLPDLELTALAVHPHLELNALELLHVLMVVGAAQVRKVLHSGDEDGFEWWEYAGKKCNE